jgi:hypothetical protein
LLCFQKGTIDEQEWMDKTVEEKNQKTEGGCDRLVEKIKNCHKNVTEKKGRWNPVTAHLKKSILNFST